MILTGGEIYFLGETDLRTGKETGFVKIGLVREKDARDTESRLREHQTGNPRMLHVVKVVKTPIVERVETTLHGKFATSRVSGEWFNFNSIPVETAIAEASTLSKNAKANLEDLNQAEILKSKKSTQKTIPSNKETIKLYQDYLQINFQLKQCKELSKHIQDVLYQASLNKLDIDHLLEVQKRKPAQRFSEEIFAEKFPKIYSQYVETVNEIKQRFTWGSAKDIEFNLQKLNKDLFELVTEASSLSKTAVTKSNAADKLHFLYLTVLTHQSPLEWKKDLIEAKVKSACGLSSGIEDICKWNRAQEERQKLNRDAVKEAHLKKYEECFVLSKATEAVVVKKDRGYRF
jgi:hypothetical protein